MSGIANLKLSLTRFSVACVDRGSLGLHFVKCFVLRKHEDVVTDHLLVLRDQVRVLDSRE